MLVHREHRETFLFNSFHGEFCDSAYIKHMYSATFDNSDNGRAWQKSELELVAVAEGGRPFVQATYFLEGDGLVILFVYDWLKHIELFIQNEHFPVIDSYIELQVDHIEDVGEQEVKRAELKEYALSVMWPGFQYFFNNLLAGDIGANLRLFKAVRLANPSYIKHTLAARGLAALQQEVRELGVLKTVDDTVIQQLLAELPSYSQKCAEFAGNWLFGAPSTWANITEVKSFKKVARPTVGLEILQFFEDQSDNALIDYVCASLMLKANGREILP